MLWVDNFRPNTLEKLDYNQPLTEQLKKLVIDFALFLHQIVSYLFFILLFSFRQSREQASSGDFPHLLVYGPSGAGKKTRVSAVLKELYGPGVEKVLIMFLISVKFS